MRFLIINKIPIFIKTVVLGIGLLLIFYSCKHNCGDFNTDLLNWLPYQPNDILTFTYNDDTTITLTAGITQIHHTKNYPANALCMCSDEVTFTASNPGYWIQVRLMSSGSGSNPDFNFTFNANNGSYQFYNNYADTSSIFILNGKTFENVKFLQINSYANDTGMAVVSKYYGIIYIEINDDHWEIPLHNPSNGNFSSARFEEAPC